MLRKIVDLGGVHVAGKRIRRCSQTIRAGEVVEVFLDGQPLDPYRVDDASVLYRDHYLLALDKPAGVESQPTPARYKGTLYEALGGYLQNPWRPKDRPALGMVQRLDRETSGVMVFSIHPKAHRPLTAAFAERGVRKLYLALVSGTMEKNEGRMRSLLARNRASNLMRSVARGGKEAITCYRVVERFASASLVEVELLTGRSHQIRAHFSEAGHPLLGDVRYGGPDSLEGLEIPRQMLHSRQLLLPHPVTGEALDLRAPIPQDLKRLLGHLGQSKNRPNIPKK